MDKPKAPAAPTEQPLAATYVVGESGPDEIGSLGLPTIAGSDSDRYEFRRVLGVGGMGEVRLCSDRRIGREVAFKIARTASSTPQTRFVREALLQARLEHPSFVPVYDVGTTETGELFFTMRRIRGRTLHEVLYASAEGKSVAFGRRRILAAFVQLCLAVDYAHSRGVVHRDLKPGNVMLGDFGEVYVLDWGIARIAGDAPVDPDAPTDVRPAQPSVPSGPRATVEGTVLGTPGYMAPEQLRGEHATLDGRADVYSLGAILFEILAASPLHQGASVLALADSTLGDTDRDPASRAPHRDVPPELAAISLRATELDRDRRFGSARELANAVDRFLEGDRDAALRRRQAEDLAARASSALGASADPAARAEAGRDAVRALAFDPANALARRALLDVITAPPRTIPDEARETASAAHRAGARTLLGWYSSGIGIVCIAFAALLLASGVRDVVLFATMLATGFGSVAVLAVGSRLREGSAAVQTLGFALLCVTNALLTRWMSPWIVVPITMMVNAVAMTFYATPRQRALRIAMVLASVLVPFGLEEVGAIDPSYVLEPDRIVIMARLADFTGWLPWLLAGLTAAMLCSSYVVAATLARIRSIELRFHAQAWMLRQVIGAPSADGPTAS